jgi:phosphoglycolate phosphatase-like HAD superfamily hydrolase
MIAIFDVEGTLVDSAAMNLKCWQETLEEYGIAAPIEVLQLYLGMDGNDMLQIVVPALDRTARRRLIKRDGELYRERYLRRAKAFPHVRPLFGLLKKRGDRVALATDCDAEEITFYRSIINADDLIDAVACGDDVEEGKPHSELIKNAIRKVDGVPDEAIMVGDTPYDAEAAVSAGAEALGVLTGGFSRDTLLEGGCVDVAPDLIELARIFESGS